MRVDLLSVSLLDCHYANESPKEYVNGLIEPKKKRERKKNTVINSETKQMKQRNALKYKSPASGAVFISAI